VPLIDTRALKETEGFSRWSGLGAELCVMAFVTEILPEGIFDVPSRGTIQYHPSLLPLHRGISSIAWPIIFGEAETGVTIFWPDEGIDTGPILLQERGPIGPDDTVASLYFNSLFPMGVDAMSPAVAMVADGSAPRIAQDHAASTYEPPIDDTWARIPWHEPADRVYARIRGCNSQPGAWTTFRKKKVRVFDSELLGEAHPGVPGTIVRLTDDGIDVRLNGAVLRVKRVQSEGQKKTPAAEWAAGAGLREGSRFR
jgi:methionyl-tRNA formyltransferase